MTSAESASRKRGVFRTATRRVAAFGRDFLLAPLVSELASLKFIAQEAQLIAQEAQLIARETLLIARETRVLVEGVRDLSQEAQLIARETRVLVEGVRDLSQETRVIAQDRKRTDALSEGFVLAYRRFPNASEIERMNALLPAFQSQDLARTVRRIVAMFDRQTYATPISVRFGAEDLTTLNLGDFRLVLDTGDFAVSQGIVGAGNYEPHLASFFVEHIKPGMTVVDIGANIGFFTMLSAARVGPTGRVLAFEPNTENCRLILLSAEANGFHNIELHPLALSSKRGNLFFSPAIGGNGGLLPSSSDTLMNPNCIVVPCEKLDNMGIDRVDFIKADIEGAEYIALLGGETILKRDRPIVTVEFSLEMLSRVSGIAGADFLNWMVDLGYRAYLVGRTDTKYQEITDIAALIASWKDPGHIEDIAFIPKTPSQ